ncbi:MAG TPA: HAMP domain-containing sensor histidine kinase, partial [Cytophagaceae bacterium]|nr:HAMP domain-containing sensor histidine kinase [Cytophagaceae bacterium]
KPDKHAGPVKGIPQYRYNQHYFCVYFPFKPLMILTEMNLWIGLSALLLLIFIFFSYALYTILKQKHLSEIQRDFINTMTHEFQTPISTIYLSSEVIKDPSIIQHPERLTNYATIIQAETIRLKKQVESVLQVAKIDKQKINLSKEYLSVEKLLYKVADYILQSQPLLSKEDLSFKMEDQLPLVYADPLHLFNIMYNLIDNAIKYSDKNVAITISTRRQKKGVVFQIADQGIGLKKSDLNKIFHKFYRSESIQQSTNKGFGIGLYYVKLVVSAHGGHVTVESEPGKGSTFSIYLPLSN